MSLMGLDIGTTGCKAVIFDTSGRILASSYREYELIQPRENWIELDPELVWANVKEVIGEANAHVAMDPVIAVGVSSQGETVLPLSTDGECLYNFVVTFDMRTIKQAQAWEEKLGAAETYRITGMPPHPMYSLHKIVWFKEERPEIYRSTHKFLLVEDFIIYRLTGSFGIDFSLAARTMALDVIDRRWSRSILDRAGVDPDLLSPAVPSGTIIGEVKAKLQAELGFQRPVAVVTGGHDQPCGALGAGIYQDGIAMNATGTVDCICPVFKRPTEVERLRQGNFASYPYVIDGLFCSIGFNLTGGLLLKWYRDTLCQDERSRAVAAGLDPYDVILGEMSDQAKDLFVLPHFVGTGTPYLDPYAKGAIVGLKISTTKGDLTRSILESINYEMKINLELLQETGITLREIRAVGGGAKSATWLKLKASCYGIPVTRLETSEAVSLGAAILAGYAVKQFASIQEGVERMVHTAETFLPDTKLQRIYEEKYLKYRKLYGHLQEFNHSIQ